MNGSLRVPKSGDAGSVGYTLLELLLSTAILMLLVAMIAQLFFWSSSLWTRAEERMDAIREGRAALQVITRDLADVYPGGGKLPILHVGDLYRGGQGGGFNRQIYAIVPRPKTGGADLCGVGFYCVWDAGRRSFVLRRHFVGSDALCARLSAAGLPAAAEVVAGDVFHPAVDVAIAPFDENLASFVWDFRVVPFEIDPSTGEAAPRTDYPKTYRDELPAFIEILFKAVGPASGERFRSLSVGPKVWFNKESVFYRTQLAPRIQIFRTRVGMNAGARNQATSTPVP